MQGGILMCESQAQHFTCYKWVCKEQTQQQLNTDCL